MESLKSITELILNEAEDQYRLIILDAKDVSTRIREQQKKLALEKIKELTPKILEKAKKKAETIRLQIILNEQIQSKWKILAKQEECIEKILQEVKKQLKKFTQDKKYVPIIEKLIFEAATNLGGNELDILLNNRDSALPINYDKIAKNVEKKTGVKTKFNLVNEKINSEGGVIVKSSDGKVLMDNTFEGIFDRKEIQLRFIISKLLFG